jgi:hypothetical protein
MYKKFAFFSALLNISCYPTIATPPIYTGSYSIPNAKGITLATGNNFYVGSGSTLSLYNQSGNLISSFASAGSGNGQFNGIRSIAYDPTLDNIAVLDQVDNDNGRLQVINTAGIYQWDYKGSGNQVNDVQAVTFNSNNNNYYFTSSAYRRVITVTHDTGTFVNNISYNSSGFNYLWGIAFNPQNNRIYIADVSGSPESGLQVFTESGTYLSQVTTTPIRMVGIDPSTGNVYAKDASQNRIYIYDQDNTYLETLIGYGSQNEHESQMAFDPATGKIYITQGISVAVFFNPATWTQPGTSYLKQLPLDQNLTLAIGYNLDVKGTTTLASGAILTLQNGTFSSNSLTFDGGTLNMENDYGALIATPITIAGPGTITGTSALTLSGVISGPSSLTLSNTDTITLTGANTYSGGPLSMAADWS